ncbi:MAG TPA: chemotaxis-specific protein-glutamate methyltransferase CheB [Pyrinomonadaceae bacterium]|nr:chemotaxis-specific protein-glutamate methyltransferase CheB [Pyrinomonadaceae bacterium]
MIKALVVDDSKAVREFLMHILSSDPEIQVVGAVSNGEEALEAVKNKRPDVITMDIRMPKMNGLEATRLIMETYPTPIVVVSGSFGAEEAASFRALEAGALAVLTRPMGVGHSDHEAMAHELVRTVKLMSEVKVVKRGARARDMVTMPSIPFPAEVRLNRVRAEIKLVAIGASTGGPIVLQEILSSLPRNYPLPILIVQHIAAGFVSGFAEWLGQSSGWPVHVATQGECLLPGHAVVAPDEFHMGVSATDRIVLSRNEPENGLRPAVSFLFRSVAHVFGRSAVGVLLTGMGKDGAHELKLMKEKGAITVAQDEESSVIHGMPGEAVNLGAATYVLSPGGIASVLTRLADNGIRALENS